MPKVGALKVGHFMNRGLEVLVLDDDPISRRVMLAFLMHQGHRTMLTQDGVEALALLRDRSFDIAFLDLRMPGFNGLDLTRTWRAEEPLRRHLPLVALTCDTTPEIRENARIAGIDAFLVKPITPKELEAVIHRYCSNRETSLTPGHQS